MYIIKLIIIYLSIIFFPIYAQYKVYFYNKIEGKIVVMQVVNRKDNNDNFALVLRKGGDFGEITENEFAIVNFSNLIYFEKTEIICSEIQIITKKFTQGYVLKLFINNRLIGDICATNYLPTDKNINANLEFINSNNNMLLKFTNIGWFYKEGIFNHSVEINI